MDHTSDVGEWENFRRQLPADGGREFRRFGLRDRGARLAAAVRTLPHRLCKSTLSCVAAMHRWWPLRANSRHSDLLSSMGRSRSERPRRSFFTSFGHPAERVARHGGSVVNVSVQILRGEVPPGLARPQGVRLWPGVVVTNDAADGV